MNALMILIMALALNGCATMENKTTVTKIHEDDQISILTSYNGRLKERKIHGYDFNIPVALNNSISTEMATGQFLGDTLSEGKKYYQFKSNDNTVWWLLTEEEIGFIPSIEKQYTLVYCNNGTTKENKSCGCLPEWECECEVYDDVFIEIYEEMQSK